MSSQYKLRSFKCAGCEKDIEKRCPKKTTYCSLECYRSSERKWRKTGFNVKCANCQKEFYITKSAKRDRNFCSVACHNAYQGRLKSVHFCKICGSEFRWSPSRIKAQNPTYCSIDCRNKCQEWKFNAVISGNIKQQSMKGPTSLEVAGYAILDSMGVDYERQVLIANKFTVDATISGKPIVIQWDGDYWHGYREVNDNTPLDHRQAKRVRLDKSQDAYMRKIGYVVLRFWEHDVFNQKEMVREVISRAIQQAAA